MFPTRSQVMETVRHLVKTYPDAVFLLLVLYVVGCVQLFRERLRSACELQKRSEKDMSSFDRTLVVLAPWFAVSLGAEDTVTQTELASMRRSEETGPPRGRGVEQPFDAFLVLDVEGTCVDGPHSFNYPNEIIEWPVLLLRWKDKDQNGIARGTLEIADTFRSYVKPTWRPQLSEFCVNLTGISQEQVDSAPTFKALLQDFRYFLEKNGLIAPETGEHLVKFVWCSDGPWDIRDFVVKQCFISKIKIPNWISEQVLDVRAAVRKWSDNGVKPQHAPAKRRSLSITNQLQLLGLSPFEGRQHSGIDDARNVARILIELARRGMKLEPNTHVNRQRRWPWMGKRGKVLEGYF